MSKQEDEIQKVDISEVQDELVDQGVEAKLSKYHLQYKKAIRALRSYKQAIDSPNFHLDEASKLLIEETIEVESEGLLTWRNGDLCEIWDYGEEFQHHGKIFGRELGENPRSVRGLFVTFTLDEDTIECVDLDGGRSRAYFDSMDDDKKEQFVSRFAERRRSGIVYIGKLDEVPKGYCAFITDDDAGYVIEKIVDYRDYEKLFEQT